jgi:hypothetical protein
MKGRLVQRWRFVELMPGALLVWRASAVGWYLHFLEFQWDGFARGREGESSDERETGTGV